MTAGERKTPVRRALLSVTDKTGITDFAQGLADRDFEVVSTGGTARAIREAGVPVTDIAEITGFPEMMDGRVKTLHPKVHGGLLALRENSEHVTAMQDHEISPIDVVAVNLYAFRETVAKPGVSYAEAIENIDIGGPSMIRSAAKNHGAVWVVTDPADYDAVLQALDDEKKGADGLPMRRSLAGKAYTTTAAYDAAICNWFSEQEGEALPERLVLEASEVRELRYGENPHQQARFYTNPGIREPSIATAEVLSGKALSYNNIMDADGALELVKEFDVPAAAVIKHTNPCGCGVADDIATAFERAWLGDSQSAFGGIVSLNRPVTEDLARAIAKPEHFLEVIVAPSYEGGAVEILKTGAKWGKNVRILATGSLGARSTSDHMVRKVTGGFLVQQRDLGYEHEKREVVSARQPEVSELDDLEFAWRVCKHVKSNAIVLAKEGTLLGVGAGQMSRVDSVFMAGHKAGERTKGAVLASDAFFPFRDSIDEAARLGVTAVIQPGGSIRDKESVAAVDEHGMALVLTGSRHFRH
ncbi:MAG: bifunctional phosphoribosylaminoimidazolecarboxamide formyltransferase/IMP cyclohydrolase [Planctomycetota bacterium]|nr:bifunctional phosphoribosylaminoimidazolecarboxamide formyltransferase/IMP cyclohydrolase [Planctomycetota bacterium]